MKQPSSLKAAFVSLAILAMIAGGAALAGEEEDSKVEIGLSIAPVRLNLEDKDRHLVGLGSFIVNAMAACNDCHTTGDPRQWYLPGGNPFFGQPGKVNPAVYLGGGRDFGALIPGSADIVSRNLTPDQTGRPAGGRTFGEFRQIMRTGVDLDKLHPTCTGAPNSGCVPPPFDGSLLQIMPWAVYQNMTDGDLRAIYEYLSAIPCVAGPPSPSPLHNDCN
jgi:hypothetical protein